MPYIKKIELRGFKSFGQKNVRVILDKGFTAITGPNGSGKTNIVDAILFALGELRMKRLRAENSAKLIFHGSEKSGLESARKAKVLIQFDNDDGHLPIDTTTVTISREVSTQGQSVYRLNGRRISRKSVLEVLSMAGLSSTSQNIIMQGTVTRAAEVSSTERMKIIEDLVGIAQYDNEKAEAEEKIRVADISTRTAMGRIDEVQKRIDTLERERNELLRQAFIEKEITKFEAIKLSYEIAQLQEKMAETSSQVDRVEVQVNKLKQLRQQLMSKRRLNEGDWRRLSSEMVEEGGSQVLRIQIRIGELKSRITELTSKISTGKASLEGLKEVRGNNQQQHTTIRKEINEYHTKTRQLKRKRQRILEEANQKQADHDALAEEATQLWENLGEHSQKIRETEEKLDEYYQKLTDLNSEIARSRQTINTYRRRIGTLGSRKVRLEETLNDLARTLDEFRGVQRVQKSQLKSLDRMLEKRIAQKEIVKREMHEAGKIAESARESVVEFATQRELAETVAAEKAALRNIEELAEIGAISGVYGRLRGLIKVDRTYEKAIEAAAAGWLDAIVVKDLEAAFTCTETLRKMKLGRIKMILTEGTLSSELPIFPERDGVEGTASIFMKYAKKYRPAVSFVFGDTLVVSNEKTALALSSKGYRTVTVNGDVYEAGGGLESGYYRAPIDLSAIIPSDTAIESLDKAVTALQKHLSQRSGDIVSFDEEIDETKAEIVRLSETMTALDTEMTRIRRNIKRIKTAVKRIHTRVAHFQNRIEAEKTQIGLHKAEKSSIKKEMGNLREKLTKLREKTDPTHIQDVEVRRDRLAEETITFRQRIGMFQTQISTLESQYENVLKVGQKNSRIQLRKVKQQIRKVEKEVNVALQERESLNHELTDLEKTRIKLSKTVLSARKEAKKFMTQIDEVDEELKKLDSEYEPADRLLNKLQLKNQTYLLKLEQHQDQLAQYDYDQPLEVTQKQIEEAETSLKMMQFELERIGAVNQLALSHYSEQISRYKELSLRLNELEREKGAIVQFMEEVEYRKRKVFLDAYEKINHNLQEYFSKVTGGGNAALKLENADDPFSGGVDMTVQFPNKPSIVVSGASGGERSVAAVAFIFALKEFTPASFYILDEVDAHLDAFHVSRLADLLLEESKKTQFIAITLKPEMVNKAEKVYGVYERNGVSSVVSAKFPKVTD